MPMPSVSAVYDGEQIRLLEEPPVQGPYRVVVTFVEPAHKEDVPRQVLDRFWASFGAWQDDRSAEEIVGDIYAARRSKTEPPAL
jgi:hypothetical protein